MEFEKIERYLNNELDSHEKEIFEKQISENKQLATTIKVYKLIDEEMQTNPEQEKGTIETINALSKKHFHQAKAPIVSMNRIFKITAVAASIIGLLFVGKWLFAPNSVSKEELLAMHFPKENISLTERGSNDDTLYQVEQFFNGNQPQQVLNFIQPYIRNHPDAALEIIAIKALLQLNKSQEAIDIASKISNGRSAFKYEAMLLMAVAYSQMDDWSNVVSTLQQVPPTAIEYERAKSFLQDIEHVK